MENTATGSGGRPRNCRPCCAINPSRLVWCFCCFCFSTEPRGRRSTKCETVAKLWPVWGKNELHLKPKLQDSEFWCNIGGVLIRLLLHRARSKNQRFRASQRSTPVVKPPPKRWVAKQLVFLGKFGYRLGPLRCSKPSMIGPRSMQKSSNKHPSFACTLGVALMGWPD